MKNTKVPFWLIDAIFTGREGDEGEGNDEGEEGEGEEGEEGEGEGEDGSGSDSDDLESLKKALAKERQLHREERKARRKAERDARTAATNKENDEEAKNLEETSKKLASSEEKTTRLAAKLLNNERDAAIKAEAKKQGFIDPSDALTDEIRGAIDIDQDPEDPSDIDIDESSVAAAVKKLAAKKKHLVGTPGDGLPSGGRFRKSGGAQDNEADFEKKYKEMYPSLS